MAGEPNEALWRGVRPTDPEEPFTVIQGTAANLKVQAAIAAGQSITVVQANPVNLVATVIGNDTFPIKVKQDTAADLKVEAAIAAAQSIAITQTTAANLKGTIVDSYISQDCVSNGHIDPTSGLVLVDSDELIAGRYDFKCLITCTVNHDYCRMQHRNAANGANVFSWYFLLGAYGASCIDIPNWRIETNERLRIVMHNNLTGTIYVVIWWTKRA